MTTFGRQETPDIENALARQLRAIVPEALHAALQAAIQPLREDIQRLEGRLEGLESHLASALQVPTGAQKESQVPPYITDFLRQTVPRLDGRSHKGQNGRIGVLGGSVDFTGAPYYAGIAALRTGAELIYMLTAQEATVPLKSYSPELMVSPVYSFERITIPELFQAEQQTLVDKISDLTPRLHCLCIGCGMGRNEAVLQAVAVAIEVAKARDMPIVLDADALWLVAQRPDVIKGYRSAVLIPNSMEFRLLAKATTGNDSSDLRVVADALRGPTILLKGQVDRAYAMGEVSVLECNEPGTPRRPGGLGDVLAGVVATMMGWLYQRRGSNLHACLAAATIVRRASRFAFEKKHRAMVAPDVIEELGRAMQEVWPA